jgi:capsule polysaccharide export protein KpsE/RkpR
MFGFMTGLSSMTGTSGFSRMLGGMVPGVSTPSDLYAAIMQSSRIKREIIKKFDLQNEFSTKNMHDTYRALTDITKVDITPEGIISVAITYKDKYLATDIANAYVEELDKFNTETAMTVGKRYRIFIEQRLQETLDSLEISENALRDFQQEHRTIALDIEIQSAIETIAQLKGEIILLEVKRGALSSANVYGNPYVQNIDQQIRELRRQLNKLEMGSENDTIDGFGVGFSIPLSDLPTASLKYIRLMREVKIQEAIYELLTQQYEQAKIMELKDTPTVQFLDHAGVPEKRSHPRRMLLVMIVFVLGLFVNIPLVFILEYISDVQKNPDEHKTINFFWIHLGNDAKRIKNTILLLLKKKTQ